MHHGQVTLATVPTLSMALAYGPAALDTPGSTPPLGIRMGILLLLLLFGGAFGLMILGGHIREERRRRKF